MQGMMMNVPDPIRVLVFFGSSTVGLVMCCPSKRSDCDFWLQKAANSL